MIRGTKDHVRFVAKRYLRSYGCEPEIDRIIDGYDSRFPIMKEIVDLMHAKIPNRKIIFKQACLFIPNQLDWVEGTDRTGVVGLSSMTGMIPAGLVRAYQIGHTTTADPGMFAYQDYFTASKEIKEVNSGRSILFVGYTEGEMLSSFPVRSRQVYRTLKGVMDKYWESRAPFSNEIGREVLGEAGLVPAIRYDTVVIIGDFTPVMVFSIAEI